MSAITIGLTLLVVLLLLNEYLKMQYLGLWVGGSTGPIWAERDGTFGVRFVKYNLTRVPNKPVLTYKKTVLTTGAVSQRFTPVFGNVNFEHVDDAGVVTGGTKIERVGESLKITTRIGPVGSSALTAIMYDAAVFQTAKITLNLGA